MSPVWRTVMCERWPDSAWHPASKNTGTKNMCSLISAGCPKRVKAPNFFTGIRRLRCLHKWDKVAAEKVCQNILENSAQNGQSVIPSQALALLIDGKDFSRKWVLSQSGDGIGVWVDVLPFHQVFLPSQGWQCSHCFGQCLRQTSTLVQGLE